MNVCSDIKNENAKRPNFHKGSQSHSPSQTNGSTKIQIHSVIAIPKLQELAQKIPATVQLPLGCYPYRGSPSSLREQELKKNLQTERQSAYGP